MLNEKAIADILTKENEEYRKLGEEHKNFDNMLAELDRKRYLTPEEEMERKKLQKLKLSRKDRMAELVRDYKKQHSAN